MRREPMQTTSPRRRAGTSPLLMVVLLLAAFQLAGCASAPKGQVYDPLEKVNRGTTTFNDYFDKIVLKPLSEGYIAVTNDEARKMVSNFFDNATYADTIVNDFLQGKGKQGASDVARLVVNTTVGVAGFFDPATSLGLVKHDEDFGQTLGVWGFGPGAYVVVPVYGPNTARDLPALATSTLTSAVFWSGFFLTPYVTIPVSVLSAADLRSRSDNAIRFVNETALDPYVFMREAWVQHRDYLIYDGKMPVSLEDDFSDDFGN